jgi:NAD(P)-dependent dehydrogenase (short-subunit alcohol dehydrogenase family)
MEETQVNGWTVVTGATGAVGAAAAEALAAQGRPVILACRNAARAEALRAGILSRVPQARLEVRLLDLASLGSVRAFAEGLGGERVEALFNNAGVISRDYSLTPEGFENTFCVNYFAPFLLTQLVAGRMQPGACVVNMVSLTCRFVRVDEAALQPAEKDFSQLGTYARSKLALLHFSQEFARRRPDLRVNVADPGIVNSGMISMGRWFDPLADVLFRPFCKSPKRAAIPPLAALSSDRTGCYFAGSRCVPIPERYRDPDLERRLWTETERLL